MAGVYGQCLGRRLSIGLGKHVAVFQAEVYAILAYVYEIQTQDRPEKYVSTVFAFISMRLCKHFSLPNISIGVSSPKGVE
jgi:hypothetical protein